MPLVIDPWYCAVAAPIAKMVTGLASSEGWKDREPTLIHEVAPLTSYPRPGTIGSKMRTASRTMRGMTRLARRR